MFQNDPGTEYIDLEDEVRLIEAMHDLIAALDMEEAAAGATEAA